jgi:hypothetical protein
LAVGFLLVILSCALWHAYYPLLVVATYVLAPLPNWICARCTNPDDFGAEGGGNALLDFGKFVTGGLVVMGVSMYKFLLLVVKDKEGRRKGKEIMDREGNPVAGRKRYRGTEALEKQILTVINSPSSSPGTLRDHYTTSNDHVHHRGAAHLRHDCLVRDVLPRGARVLSYLKDIYDDLDRRTGEATGCQGHVTAYLGELLCIIREYF